MVGFNYRVSLSNESYISEFPLHSTTYILVSPLRSLTLMPCLSFAHIICVDWWTVIWFVIICMLGCKLWCPVVMSLLWCPVVMSSCDVLLWCPVVMSCCDVMLWCPHVMSCCDALLWCPVVMSSCDVLMWCPVEMACCDVLMWCPVVMSCCDVLMWCPLVMSSCDVLMWCPHVMSSCDVLLWCPHMMSSCDVLFYLLGLLSTIEDRIEMEISGSDAAEEVESGELQHDGKILTLRGSWFSHNSREHDCTSPHVTPF